MLRRRRKVPVVLCIDVEPDPRLVDRLSPPPWEGFVRSAKVFAALREDLAGSVERPVRFSWFLRMDPQVRESYGSAAWVAEKHPELVESFAREGDELGLHVHMFRWDEGGGIWICDHGNPAWIFHCIEDSFDAFARSLGRPCRSVRLGDGWTSGAAIAQLESLGVRFDLTAEPESRPRDSLIPSEPSTGGLPGYLGIPHHPYHPSLHDFRISDPSRKDALWIIPMTAGTGAEATQTAIRGDEKPASPARQPSSEDAPWRTLNLTLDPGIFRVVVAHNLASLRRPYLAFMVRTDFCLHADELEAARENLALLRANARAWRLAFTTPPEALALLGM